MDDVDEFLASLDQFASPTIELGIARAAQHADFSGTAAPYAQNREINGTSSCNRAGRRGRQREEGSGATDGASEGTTGAAAAAGTAQEGHEHKRSRRRVDGDSRSHPPLSTNTSSGNMNGFSALSASLPQASQGAPSTTVPQPQAQGGGASGSCSNRSSNGAGGGATAGVTLRAGGSDAIGSSWTCTRCTLINSPSSRVCAACDTPIPSVRAGLAGAQVGCPTCTFFNSPGSRICEMCARALPLLVSTTAGAPVIPSNREVDAAVTAPEVTPAGASHGESARHRDDDSFSSSSDDNDEEDGTEDEEVSDIEDGMDEQQQNGSYDALDNRELVRFLQTLESVPFDKLPEAPVPASMSERGHLRPFQLQALHWLHMREGHSRELQQRHNTCPRSGSGGDNGQPSPTPSFSSLHNPAAAMDVDETDEESSPTAASTNDGVGSMPYAAISSRDVQSVRGGVFADYMGLGKTRTLIALCEATRGPRYDRVTGSQVASPATLIVCPTSLLSQWAEEIHSCVTPAPRVLLYYGARRRRLNMFQVAQNYDYVLCSYQTLRFESAVTSAEPGKMYMIRWKRVILDEAHYIRNVRTQQSRACLQLTAKYKWAVTATPTQNSVNDLYPLLKFLQVPHFSALDWWNSEIVRYFNMDSNHPRPTTALRLLFSSLLLRRTPDSIVNGRPILDLPPKEVVLTKVPLSREEAAFYLEIHEAATRKLDTAQRHLGQLRTFGTAFEMLMRCRQTCLHPYIVVAALRRFQAPPSSAATSGSLAAAASSASAETEAKRKSEVAKAIETFIDRVLLRRMKANKQAEFVQELIKELKEQEIGNRECTICMDTLNVPVILPCGHTYCEGCINHAFQMKRECPMCKRATRPADALRIPPEILADSPVGTAAAAAAAQPGQKPSPLQSVDGVDVSNFESWPASLSSKTMVLLENILRIPLDEKIVVFSSFVTYLNYVQYCLNKANVSSSMYTGSLSLRQKQKVLQQFRGEVVQGGLATSSTSSGATNPAGTRTITGQSTSTALVPATLSASSSSPRAGPRVLLATITSCGVGINLTCANHCFLMEPTWNPGTEEQALNRIHRIGQTRPVRVMKLIAHSTVEEKIEALCQQKRLLSGYCCNAQEGAVARRLRTEDLLALFVNESSSSDEESSSSSSISSNSDSDSDSSE